MRPGLRIFAIMTVAFSLVPALCADDTAKAAAAAKAGTVNSGVAFSAVAKAQPAATPSASLPAAALPHLRGMERGTPRVELFVGGSFFGPLSTSAGNRIAYLFGGSTSIAINANRYLGLVADFGGYHADRFGPGAPPNGSTVNASGSVFTYMFGPRLSFRHGPVTPFVQALFGGAHAGIVTLDNCSGVGCSPLPTETAFTMTAGGGLDITIYHHIAFRVVQAEYAMTRFADRSTLAARTGTQNDMRLSMGLVFRFGGKRPPPPPPPPPAAAANQPPVISSCPVDKDMVYAASGDVVTLRAQASDPDNDPLTYSWTATGGAVEGSGSEVRWNSSGVAPGTYTVRVRVSDGRGGTADCSADIRVEPRGNRPPTMSCSADRSSTVVGERVRITATASSPDSNPLTYSWSTSGGQIIGSGSSVTFDSSGMAPGPYTVKGHVDDGRGGTADCSVDLDVQAAQVPAVVKELETRLELHSIYFPTAQPTALHPDTGLVVSQQKILRTLAEDFKKYLTLNPNAHLILEGHADQRASVAYNNALTERRVARSKSFLVEQGVPEASIETRSLGKQELLNSDQVKEQMLNNPELSPQERRRIQGIANWKGIVLAMNRRLDIVLKATGQESTRRYPFNAKDALTLLDDRQLVR